MPLTSWPCSKPLFLVALLACAGCGKNSSSNPEPEPAETKKEEKPAAPSVPEPTTKVQTPKPPGYDRLHQSFAEATRKEPPADELPPERTLTGKSVGKLFTTVTELWDAIHFMKPDGTRIHYSATIETELGNIEVALDADHAPNHVRNFVALSRAGYYDGLVFDRIHQEDAPGQETGRYEEIEAGCPLGTGEWGKSSIGYWLRPEISDGTTHEEGAIGACHAAEKDTATCKFYITLCKAPYLDGEYTIFGKVTAGMDVARKIYLQPTVLEDQDVDGSRRPQKPVVIRKVTIHTREGRDNVSRR